MGGSVSRPAGSSGFSREFGICILFHPCVCHVFVHGRFHGRLPHFGGERFSERRFLGKTGLSQLAKYRKISPQPEGKVSDPKRSAMEIPSIPSHWGPGTSYI